MTFFVGLAGLFIGLALIGLIYCLSLMVVPPREPRGIPTVPFWVALLPLLRAVDQQAVFQTHIAGPLRRHGADKVFFAGRWNVLVHRPALMADIFKHEHLYCKSGNQYKIPGSVLASFLGDNIISSHGDVWRLYRDVVRPSLQAGSSAKDGGEFIDDLTVLWTNATRLQAIFLEAQARSERTACGKIVGVSIQDMVQWYTMANFAQVNYRVNLSMLGSEEARLDQLQRRLKRHIFRPLFMNFPVLDRLGLPSREHARRLAAHFTHQLVGVGAREGGGQGGVRRNRATE